MLCVCVCSLATMQLHPDGLSTSRKDRQDANRRAESSLSRVHMYGVRIPQEDTDPAGRKTCPDGTFIALIVKKERQDQQLINPLIRRCQLRHGVLWTASGNITILHSITSEYAVSGMYSARSPWSRIMMNYIQFVW